MAKTKTTKTATVDAWVALVLGTMSVTELRAELANPANTAAETSAMRDELVRREKAPLPGHAAVNGTVAAKWRAGSEVAVDEQRAAAKVRTKAAQNAARKAARKAERRGAVAAPPAGQPCTKCGRVNTHGRDCRTVSACKARAAETKTKGAARRGAAQ